MSAVFRIYSGLHLGAVVELKDGTWVFGRDDSADIILTDESIAPRHAAITVAPGLVRFEPLDGRLLLAETGEAPAGLIQPGTLFRLGSVLLAWGPEDAEAGFWQEVEAAVTGLTAPGSKAADDETSATQAPEGAGAEDGLKTDADDAGEKAGGQAEQSEGTEEQSVSAGRLAAGAACLLLAAAVAFGVHSCSKKAGTDGAKAENASWTVLASEKAQGAGARLKLWLAEAGLMGELPGPSAEAVDGMLWEHGFDRLKASRADNGTYRLTGVVADDAARAKLLAFAKTFEWPVVLDVIVESDYTNAYRSAFNTLGYWPEVSFVRTKDDGIGLRIAGYMVSSVEEERAFADALRSVPPVTALRTGAAEGKSVVIERKIRYREDVEKLVAKAFEEARLGDVRVEYLHGSLRFTTTLTPEQSARVERAVAGIRKASDVPVRIDVVNVPGKAPRAAVKTAAKKSADKGGMPFRVTGVSGGALKFVTLSDGRKVFEGGTLPGGWRLESASQEKLVLSKNGRKINHPLKVKK